LFCFVLFCLMSTTKNDNTCQNQCYEYHIAFFIDGTLMVLSSKMDLAESVINR
jgi:hypothetical protein